MNRWIKLGIVLAGYGLAFVTSFFMTALYDRQFSPEDNQTMGGMIAGGREDVRQRRVPPGVACADGTGPLVAAAQPEVLVCFLERRAHLRARGAGRRSRGDRHNRADGLRAPSPFCGPAEPPPSP